MLNHLFLTALEELSNLNWMIRFHFTIRLKESKHVWRVAPYQKYQWQGQRHGWHLQLHSSKQVSYPILLLVQLLLHWKEEQVYSSHRHLGATFEELKSEKRHASFEPVNWHEQEYGMFFGRAKMPIILCIQILLKLTKITNHFVITASF